MGFPDLTNKTTVNYLDRSQDGNYEILGDFITSFWFEVKVGESLTVNSRQIDLNTQSFSLRSWISREPNGRQLFQHFHPSTGGIFHQFYDKNLVPAPPATVYATKRSEFSGITYEIRDEMVPLEPGIYYYNFHNLERQPRAFFVNFISRIC